MSADRVFVYVDGFNLFYGIKDRGWKHLYWIDPHKLAVELAPQDSDVVSVKYFTARVKVPDEKRDRQNRFLDAVGTGDAEIIQGKFSRRERCCRNCGQSWTTHEEKMTDSAIASHLVADAFLDQFDTALLIGGDTDIVPAIRMVRTHFPRKTILAWYPPRRRNDAVGNLCDGHGTINLNHLTAALMPESVTVSEGVIVQRPETWTREPVAK
jgi:uncharacterized LabA/DUF88 family protein